jgi:hypothetical protein
MAAGSTFVQAPVRSVRTMNDRAAIPFAVELTPDDYVAARRLNLRPGPAARAFLWSAGVLILLFLAWDWYSGETLQRFRPLLAPVLGGAVFLTVYVRFLLPWSVRRAYRQQPPQPLSGHVSPEGLTVTSSDSPGTADWSLFFKWKANERVVLLYYADRLFTMIPLRGFATEGDRAAALELIQRQIEYRAA